MTVRRRTPLRLLAVGALTTAGVVTPIVAADPAAAAAARLSCVVPIGVPKGDVGAVKGAGYVEIRSGCKAGATTVFQRLTLPTPKAGDDFGAATTDVRLTGTGADLTGLLVGIPNYDVGRAKNAGAVAAYRYTSSGYRLDRIITQNSPGMPGRVQSGAQFGSVLASLNLAPQEGGLTVRIGIPRLDVGSARDAGGVVSLAYTAADTDATRFRLDRAHSGLLTLSTPGVPGSAHPYDRFGAALGGSDLGAVGVPGREVAGQPGAGAVLQFLAQYGSAKEIERGRPLWFSQRTKCVTGTPEQGDHFGAALAGEWIGVPGEDLDGVADAGMVNRYFGIGSECQSLTAKTDGFQGEAHAGDRFGATLYEAHHYFDGYYYPEHLFIGSPGADTASGANSGSVSWVTERFDAADDDDLGPLVLTDFGVTAGSEPGPGAALGTALGGGAYLYAAAPGGKGLVYQFTATKTSLDVRDVYRAGKAGPGTYGTALLSKL